MIKQASVLEMLIKAIQILMIYNVRVVNQYHNRVRDLFSILRFQSSVEISEDNNSTGFSLRHEL